MVFRKFLSGIVLYAGLSVGFSAQVTAAGLYYYQNTDLESLSDLSDGEYEKAQDRRMYLKSVASGETDYFEKGNGHLAVASSAKIGGNDEMRIWSAEQALEAYHIYIFKLWRSHGKKDQLSGEHEKFEQRVVRAYKISDKGERSTYLYDQIQSLMDGSSEKESLAKAKGKWPSFSICACSDDTIDSDELRLTRRRY